MDSLCREKGRRRISAKTNPYALTAWCLRVLGNARENPGQVEYRLGSVYGEFMRIVLQYRPSLDQTLLRSPTRDCPDLTLPIYGDNLDFKKFLWTDLRWLLPRCFTRQLRSKFALQSRSF